MVFASPQRPSRSSGRSVTGLSDIGIPRNASRALDARSTASIAGSQRRVTPRALERCASFALPSKRQLVAAWREATQIHTDADGGHEVLDCSVAFSPPSIGGGSSRATERDHRNY
jgi:hypothetical protein